MLINPDLASLWYAKVENKKVEKQKYFFYYLLDRCDILKRG